jgi:hypothetical protein
MVIYIKKLVCYALVYVQRVIIACAGAFHHMLSHVVEYSMFAH